ncbi:MAG: lipopolysaccharide biosynthesis protein [Muribaculaceae bacterium]|nr:lipopolysaccharide biosynthesis protein [Muribaculaceae bacterium]
MRFRTAIIWNGLSQFGQSGITLLSTIILARMLTPDDFGLVGIVGIFIAFSQMMVDSEMGGALLRKKIVTRMDYSTLFWYNLGVSILIYGVLFLTAPYVARFYSRPELTGVIRLLSVCIVIHSFRVVQFIILLRELKFKISAIINIVSGLLSLGTAIFLAYKGYGYWALVWQQIVMSGMLAVLMTCYNKFIPVLSISKESFLYQFKFGIGLLGGNMVITIANNISTNIIAKIASLQFTGYYTQTTRLTNFFQTSISSIFNQSIYPLMSKFETLREVKGMYRNLLLVMTLGMALIIMMIELSSSWLIQIVLGESWMPVVPIFQILLLSVLPACLQVVCRNVMKTLGTTGKVMVIDSAISLLLLLALFISAFISTYSILWAIVSVQFIGAIIWIAVAEWQFMRMKSLRID